MLNPIDMPAAHKVPENHPVRSFLADRDPTIEIYVTHIDSTNASTRKYVDHPSSLSFHD